MRLGKEIKKYFANLKSSRISYALFTPEKEENVKLGCPRNEKKKNFASNRNKTKQDLFRVCFGLFRETKIFFFGLFLFFEPISKQPKQSGIF